MLLFSDTPTLTRLRLRLKIDQVLNATALAITALQVVLSVIAAVSFPA